MIDRRDADPCIRILLLQNLGLQSSGHAPNAHRLSESVELLNESVQASNQARGVSPLVGGTGVGHDAGLTAELATQGSWPAREPSFGYPKSGPPVGGAEPRLAAEKGWVNAVSSKASLWVVGAGLLSILLAACGGSSGDVALGLNGPVPSESVAAAASPEASKPSEEPWIGLRDPVFADDGVVVVGTCRLEPRTQCPGVRMGSIRDLWEFDLAGANFAGADLTDATLTSSVLSGADLTGANLTNAMLREILARGVILRDANLTDADLAWATLTGAQMQGANLTGVNLNGTVLTAAVTDASTTCPAGTPGPCTGPEWGNDPPPASEGCTAVADGDCQAMNLYGAYLGGLDLHRIDFRAANLAWSDLSGSDLSMANLSFANLTGANLAGANLTGANLESGGLPRANLTGANLTGAAMLNTVTMGAVTTAATTCPDGTSGPCTGGVFEPVPPPVSKPAKPSSTKTCVLVPNMAACLTTVPSGIALNLSSGPNVGGMSLRGADLHGADLTGINANGADLAYTNLMGATLSRLCNQTCEGVNLVGADASGADLRGATIASIGAPDANFRNADFTGGHFPRGTWQDAPVGGADFTNANFTDAVVEFDVHDTNFTGAIFTGADVSGMLIFTNKVKGLNLSKAKDIRRSGTPICATTQANAHTCTSQEMRQFGVE